MKLEDTLNPNKIFFIVSKFNQTILLNKLIKKKILLLIKILQILTSNNEIFENLKLVQMMSTLKIYIFILVIYISHVSLFYLFSILNQVIYTSGRKLRRKVHD